MKWKILDLFSHISLLSRDQSMCKALVSEQSNFAIPNDNQYRDAFVMFK